MLPGMARDSATFFLQLYDIALVFFHLGDRKECRQLHTLLSILMTIVCISFMLLLLSFAKNVGRVKS